MSLWLLNDQLNQSLLRRLALGVLAVHIALMIAYAFFARPKPLVIKVARSFNGAPIAVKVIPFLRETGQLQRALQAQNTPNNIRRATPEQRITRHVYKQSTKTRIGGTHAAGPKFTAANSNAVHSNKTQLKKLIKQHVETIKKSKKIKKLSPPKKVKTKKTIPVAPNTPAILAHEPALEQEPVTQKIAPTPQAEPEPATQIDSSESAAENTGPLDIAITNTTEEIELGLEEYEALQAYQLIQSEMGTQWHPPAGLTPKHACIILITLNGRGTVTQMHIEQSSGILAYDMAARMAINRALFPKGVWNQQVRLHF